MNASSVTKCSLRRWSILLLAGLIAAFMRGSAQAVPVWLLVVPFVLLAAEELSAESGEARGRRGDGQEAGRSSGTQRLIPVSTLAFHGVVIASVMGAHWEMGRDRGGSTGAASTSRYVTSKNSTSGGCGTGGMCGGTSGGCGSGGCGSSGAKGGGGCGSGCGGGAVAATAANASVPALPKTPATAPAMTPPIRQMAMAPGAAGAPMSMAPAGLKAQGNMALPSQSPDLRSTAQNLPGAASPAKAPASGPPDLATAIQRAAELKASQAAARKAITGTARLPIAQTSSASSAKSVTIPFPPGISSKTPAAETSTPPERPTTTASPPSPPAK